MHHLEIKYHKLFIDDKFILDCAEDDLQIIVSGIYGLINFKNAKFLVVVIESERIGTFENEGVYQIKEVATISLTKENLELKELIRNFFKLPGFIYSNYDLSSAKFHKKTKEFLFNRILLDNYMKEVNSFDESLLLKTIQGFFESTNGLTLIARRSPARAGARFLSRGIDENGDVSNFVEIEQILTKNIQISNLQIRGSIPLFWKQIPMLNYTPSLKLEKRDNDSFIEGHNKLKELYDNKAILYLNLINNYGYEYPLFNEFNNKLKNSGMNFINYEFKSDIYKRVVPITVSYSDLNSSTSLQKRIIRTNCIDSLDRTNRMQYLISRDILLYQLNKANIIGTNILKKYEAIKSRKDMNYAQLELRLNILINKNKNAKSILSIHRKMYFRMGNNLSIQYSGTPAMISLKSGKLMKYLIECIYDIFYSIQRYFIARLTDQYLQSSYEIMTGQKSNGEIRKKSFFNVSLIILILSLIIFLISLRFKYKKVKIACLLISSLGLIFFCFIKHLRI